MRVDYEIVARRYGREHESRRISVAEAAIKQWPHEGTTDWEALVCALVICIMCALVIAL